jgi:maltose alpha-D-glucosyltransferase / alpha-amylase
MGFWLELGVSGFRMDAAPFVIEETATDASSTDLVYAHLREFRDFLSWRRSDAVLLAEANVKPEAVLDYFGDGHHLQMMLNFWLNQHLFLALASENAEALIRGLTSLPTIPESAQWGMFLRNHDELDLGRLSNFEREEVYAAFGPKPEMQLYERGIRRRLAPMLGGDPRRIKLALSLLFTLPGTPVLWYGDEIGMGEDLSLDERESVRTPMQWSLEPNAGFSRAPAERLGRPVVDRGDFGFKRTNVQLAERDPDSLLNMVERMIRVRKAHHEFGWGNYRVVDTQLPAVFGLASEFEGRRVVALHNLAGTEARTKLDLSDDELDHLVDVLGDADYPPPVRGEFALNPYGFRWLAPPSEM